MNEKDKEKERKRESHCNSLCLVFVLSGRTLLFLLTQQPRSGQRPPHSRGF